MNTYLLRIDDSLYSAVKAKIKTTNQSVNSYLLTLIEKDILGKKAKPDDELQRLKREIIKEVKEMLFTQIKEELIQELKPDIKPDITADIVNDIAIEGTAKINEDNITNIIDHPMYDVFNDMCNDIEGDIDSDICNDIEPDICNDMCNDIETDLDNDISTSLSLTPQQLADRLKIHRNQLTVKYRTLKPSELTEYIKRLDPDNLIWYRDGTGYSTGGILQET